VVNFSITPISLVELNMTASWQDAEDCHTAIHHFEKFNVWRDLDLLPGSLQRSLLGRRAGDVIGEHFAGTDLVAPWESRVLRRVAPRQFRTTTKNGIPVHPAVGRFYPQQLVEGVDGVFSGNMQPMRLVDITPNSFTLDFNHPLAQKELQVSIEVLAVHSPSAERGGRCTECIADLLNGPGMQMRYQQRATDFFSGEPFRRLNEDSDEGFYVQPRMVQHLDNSTVERVVSLHRQLLAGRRRVLDLMSSWDSHLPDDMRPETLIGVGLNAEELNANSRLTQRVVLDLNKESRLPFPDASFDAVICTASVEYLARPLEAFGEVARLLAPGGVFVNSYSNRWFPTKAIAIWKDLHEFERLGLVGEYYKQTSGFHRLHTLSARGFPRPADDPHIETAQQADPLYSIWAYKIDR
jgi:hypothetical protein